MDKIKELKKLQHLLEEGFISKEEFQKLKNEILSNTNKSTSNDFVDKKVTETEFTQSGKKIAIKKSSENLREKPLKRYECANCNEQINLSQSRRHKGLCETCHKSKSFTFNFKILFVFLVLLIGGLYSYVNVSSGDTLNNNMFENSSNQQPIDNKGTNENNLTSKTIDNEVGEKNQDKINYENIIKEFLIAEEERDFEKIYSFFSPRAKRYYDTYNPRYSNLKEKYEYLWSFVSKSKNNVLSIKRVNEHTYDLNTNYQYFNESKKTEFIVNSTVRFRFDSYGKIIETYNLN